MSQPYPDESTDKPRIAFLSYKGLSRMAYSVIPEYREQTNIIVTNKALEDATDLAQEVVARKDTDVLLSAGANADYLQGLLDIPLIRIEVTGTDFLRALVRARRISDRIAVVTYKHVNTEIEEIKKLLNLHLEQRSYTTPDDAREAFHELAGKQYKVVIGSSLVTELAEEEGLVGILIYSKQSVREAIERAIQIARIQYGERQRRNQINVILAHLSEGIIAVDQHENVQLINPAMERLGGISQEQALSGKLSDLQPDLSLVETVRSGEPTLDKVERIQKKTLVTNRIPIMQSNRITGAILTVQGAQSINRATRNIRSRNRRVSYHAKYRLEDILGQSIAMERARNLSLRYAKTDATVLVSGPTGTGKELFAQAIHNASDRSHAPFVAVNCAAIPETLLESELFGYTEGAFTGSRRGGKSGLFEAAHTGTIFLDEISEMPVPLQTRLLRVLQEKEITPLGSNDPVPVNVRVIAATNRNLYQGIENNSFREDLFYRLNILQIRLPSLRDRSEDVSLLARDFITKTARNHDLDVDAEKLLNILEPHLRRYAWPGNVRELENVMERVVILYTAPDANIDTGELPLRAVIPEFFSDTPLKEAPSENSREKSLKNAANLAEYNMIQTTLRECGGSATRAAERLNLSRTTIWRKLKKYQSELE